MEEQKEISEKINVLKDLNDQLDNYDKLLDKMFSNEDEINFNKLNEEIDPKERCDLNWNIAFSTYTLYYSIFFLILRLLKVTKY